MPFTSCPQRVLRRLCLVLSVCTSSPHRVLCRLLFLLSVFYVVYVFSSTCFTSFTSFPQRVLRLLRAIPDYRGERFPQHRLLHGGHLAYHLRAPRLRPLLSGHRCVDHPDDCSGHHRHDVPLGHPAQRPVAGQLDHGQFADLCSVCGAR